MSEAHNPSTPNTNQPSENWFTSWFDTPYYHILYKDRNYREAQIFMDNLTHYLNLPEKANVLDLACGKGRHSIYLNQLGFNVLGADLSENSIAEASKNSNETLHFKVHDMREPFEEKFDAIFNLFTSFGYFESDDDNLTTLKAIKASLSEYGFAVIDFMNVTQVIETLVPEEVKTVDDIDFHIKRYVEDGHIFKEIDFEDQGRKFHFTEKVKALTLKDFEDLMEQAGIFLLDTFGDYKLKKFHKTDSERLIMIFK
ncbi:MULTISPECIES: bifunctional 2-polyprenyl-6-hydroxyphenol methylase/3-demethylubiquinol 3-O-methyltransferase UbiG [unclassified Flavobacterium]|jgi:SAM-dependent methyltransferase|uniref:class I SAM-dependent methyltransferase n=1 Tax=unclassified Flavobacterium TaxID=196869 RepID=UPI00057FCD92|nr:MULTISPECIES: class I SAM-dependent methyltransferase [unclassified Flavobacterium]KIA95717.1 methyltransferase [Flavobacterium sp. KMS]KIC01496.1 methyltransferase [Flavobacterium sp. JRM]OUL63693.1 SAM-dependent methyltransferase [Flavobacterium sp. AJR]